MEKYVVGLGCSWTQGQGGYPKEIWDRYNGRVDLPGVADQHLRVHEHENSWVNVLCRNHLTDYTPVNLGVRACGNRGAVKQLYFSGIDWSKGSGYIIFMLSGFDRFDFLRKDILTPTRKYQEYKFNTIWPEEHSDDELSRGYHEHWSEQLVANETMLAMLELQNFCRLYNYKLILANAFNDVFLKMYMKRHATPLYSQFDWSCYLHNKTEYIAMVEKLVEMDGMLKDWRSFYTEYTNLSQPNMYLTNCAHPTIDGYKVIANELYNFISTST